MALLLDWELDQPGKVDPPLARGWCLLQGNRPLEALELAKDLYNRFKKDHRVASLYNEAFKQFHEKAMPVLPKRD